MSATLKRQLGYGIALIGALLGLWTSSGNSVLGAGFAFCACGVVLWHVIKSDEVELLLSIRAASSAFALLLGVAILSVPLGYTQQIAESAQIIWAIMVGSFLSFWVIFRMRLG